MGESTLRQASYNRKNKDTHWLQMHKKTLVFWWCFVVVSAHDEHKKAYLQSTPKRGKNVRVFTIYIYILCMNEIILNLGQPEALKIILLRCEPIFRLFFVSTCMNKIKRIRLSENYLVSEDNIKSKRLQNADFIFREQGVVNINRGLVDDVTLA